MAGFDTGLADAALGSVAEGASGAETEVEVPAVGEGSGEGTGEGQGEGEGKGEELNEDGTPKAKDSIDKLAAPQNVRQALKAMRDANPGDVQNVAAVKALHGAYERWSAAKAIFPQGISEMKAVSQTMKEYGGSEGLAGMKTVHDLALASDEMLYAGDPKLIANIVEDLKSEGKIDALGKMAPAFMDALKANDPEGHTKIQAGMITDGLRQSEFPSALNAAYKALTDGDTAKAQSILRGIGSWFSKLEQNVSKAKSGEIDPDRAKLNADIAAHETTKKSEFNVSVATEADKYNNQALGKVLAPFLRTSFFKEFPRETLMDLGNGIKARLFANLKADTTYQKQMDAMWKAKSPDKAKILEYHNAKVDSIAEDIVRGTVQQRYPGYAKGGKAAGKVAAATARTAATTAADQKSAATGKPIFVSTKPKWDAIDHEKDPRDLLFISGKAYLKGTGRLVTWRK